MKLFTSPVDFSKVNTIIYHLPDGADLTLDIDGMQEYLDFEFDQGHICDTSKIDGIVHFFPKGNA